MPQWQVIDANQLIPSSLVEAVRDAAGVASDVIGAVRDALAGMATLPAIPDPPSPAAVAAAGLVAALDALVSGTKVHVIVIPVSKAIPAQARVPATLSDLQAWLDVRLGPTTGTAEAYQSLVAGTGGNAGFFRAFLESLFDAGDPNRPQFVNAADAVTMTVVMSGASSYAAASHAASMFDQLTRASSPVGDAGARVIPVPRGVAARPVASTTGGGRIAVQLTWDPPPPTVVLPYFPGLTVSVRRYAVIRVTRSTASSARSVLDLFPTQNLVEGLASQGATVVAIGSGLNSRFLDTDPPSGASTPLYYCVAWEVEVSEPSGVTVLPFDQLSGMVKVAPVAPAPARTGSPPDWVVAADPIRAFPALGDAVRRVLARVGSVVEGAPSPTSRLSGALGVATSMASRLAARADDLLVDVERLQASLSRPMPSIHAIQLTSGSGGNAFLAAELARRLGDVSDPARPPFDSGEYACGVCLVAGAPRLADLAPVVSLFGSLVGPAVPANPLLSIITAIDTVVTQAEATVFDPGLRPTIPPSGVSVDPLTGRPVVPATPVVSASGDPVAAKDARNPDQGDTNVTPLSALC